jgi:molybdate transport system ATP-binding protein
VTGLIAEIDVVLGGLRLEVSLKVDAGETVAVVGPNGAGKTTLLRALAGLQPLDGGRVTLDDQVLDDVAARRHVEPERRSIGVVFQDYLLFPHLSVLDNVAFGLRARGMSRPNAPARARTWLARVGLAEHSAAKPAQLSGGQGQRVALARALVGDPALLLLDEPLAALDAGTRVETRRDLQRHLREHDGVRVVVTHDPLDAAALADRLVVIEAGRVVQTGTLADLTEHPRSRYVADLVGVNLLSGRADDGHVDVGGYRLTIAEPAAGDVLLTIPPRTVTLSRVRPEGTARNVWEGKVDHVESLGDRVRLRVLGPLAIVAEVTAAAMVDLSIAEGTDVWVSIKATEIDVAPA